MFTGLAHKMNLTCVLDEQMIVGKRKKLSMYHRTQHGGIRGDLGSSDARGKFIFTHDPERAQPAVQALGWKSREDFLPICKVEYQT